MDLHQVYVLLGSNVGDREEHMRHGLSKVEDRAGRIERTSAFYETEPWGVSDQSDYLNSAALIQTTFSAHDLFHLLKEIEKAEGRIEQTKYSPRTLDIDILFYDNLILKSEELLIPHPRLQLRRFALEPMNEIASQYIHPVLKKTVAELLKECADPKKVTKAGNR